MTVDTPDQTAEAALIDRGKRGDQNVIGELFRRDYSQALKVATVILRRDEDARDAVQSAFLWGSAVSTVFEVSPLSRPGLPASL